MSDGPGTPLGRLKGIGAYAIRYGLCTGTEAKPSELFVLEELDRLRALNAKLLAALDKIVELGHYPDESIARAAIDEAKSS